MTVPLQVVVTLSAGCEEKDPYSTLRLTLENDGLIDVIAITDLALLSSTLQQVLPDLILIHTESFSLCDTMVAQLCQSIRSNAMLSYRPVLVLQTGDENETKRIEYFVHGADDVLPRHLGEEEFRVRILAHLRRHLDTLTNHLTLLPDGVLMGRMLDRAICQQLPWALLLVELEGFDLYQDIYGKVPAQQVLKTVAMLLGNLIRPPDWSAHLSWRQFGVMSHRDRAEKLAGILCRQFDGLLHTFYSQQDIHRGYVVQTQDGVTRRRPLLRLKVAIVDSQTGSWASHAMVWTTAMQVLSQLPASPKSQWSMDCRKLPGDNACPEPKPITDRAQVLVVESDAALAYLLNATLEMQGLKVRTLQDPGEALTLLNQEAFSLVIMDSLLNDQACGWHLCQSIKALAPELPVILISTLHERDKAMQSGVDVYLPKPFELLPLLSIVQDLMSPH